jgi:hypothetical protein
MSKHAIDDGARFGILRRRTDVVRSLHPLIPCLSMDRKPIGLWPSTRLQFPVDRAHHLIDWPRSTEAVFFNVPFAVFTFSTIWSIWCVRICRFPSTLKSRFRCRSSTNLAGREQSGRMYFRRRRSGAAGPRPGGRTPAPEADTGAPRRKQSAGCVKVRDAVDCVEPAAQGRTSTISPAWISIPRAIARRLTCRS